MVKLCGIKLVELTNLTVEEYTILSVTESNWLNRKKIEKSLVVLTFALFIFSYFGSVWLYLLWACLVVLTFSLFGCTYSTLSLSNCTYFGPVWLYLLVLWACPAALTVPWPCLVVQTLEMVG